MKSFTFYLLPNKELLSVNAVYSFLRHQPQDQAGGCVKATYDEMSEVLNVNRRTIQRSVARLLAEQWIERTGQTTYRINTHANQNV